MRQDSLTRSLTRLAVVLMILLFGSLTTATAAPNHLLLQSEESFQAQLGDRAVQIAQGVYRIELPSGEQIRVAFGSEGLKHDIAWLRAEISALRAQLARDSKDRSTADRLRLLTRALARLEPQKAEQENPRESIQSITAYAAEDGPVCSGYGYHLDGGHNPGMVGGTTWGEASVGPDGFGPYPPAYRCVAYSFVGTTDEYDNYSWSEDGDDQLGAASAAASVNCGYASWSCPTWESYNWIRNYGCSDGFRSIYRTQSNPG
ncbi:MAG TPA: hypothetical protein VF756_20175 [Thermoanaerobaculia bacterium]